MCSSGAATLDKTLSAAGSSKKQQRNDENSASLTKPASPVAVGEPAMEYVLSEDLQPVPVPKVRAAGRGVRPVRGPAAGARAQGPCCRPWSTFFPRTCSRCPPKAHAASLVAGLDSKDWVISSSSTEAFNKLLLLKESQDKRSSWSISYCSYAVLNRERGVEDNKITAICTDDISCFVSW